jgi:prepilin-type N-terminal cleavage/methylation domain-containing protein
LTVLGKVRRIKQEDGFTLIEILVAITVLTIIVIAFTNVLNDGMRLSFNNKKENVALALAQERMEQIKGAWPASDSELNNTDFMDPNDTVVRDGITYTREFTHENAEDPTPANWTQDPASTTGPSAVFTKSLLKAVVKVSWKNHTLNGDEDKNITFVTYLTGR